MALAVLYDFRTNGAIDVFSPLYLFFVFYAVYFVLGPINVHIFPTLFTVNDALVLRTLPAIYLGLLMFCLGYFSRPGRFLAGFVRPLRDRNNPNRVVTFIVCAYLAALVLFAALIMTTGGLRAALSNIWRVFEQISNGRTYFAWGINYLFTASILTWYAYLTDCSARKGIWSKVLFGLGVGVASLLMGVLGSRMPLIILLLSLVIFRHYTVRRLTIGKTLIAFVLFLALMVGYSVYRDTVQSGEAMRNIDVYKYLVIIQNDELTPLAKIVGHYSDKSRPLYGKTLSAIFLKPVPRVLLPNKPEGAAIVYTKTFEPAFYRGGLFNWPPSLLGELYMNFRLIGVIIGMFFTGAVFQALYRYLVTNIANRNVIILYSVMMLHLILELRGDFVVVTSGLLMSSFILILGLRYIAGGRN